MLNHVWYSFSVLFRPVLENNWSWSFKYINVVLEQSSKYRRINGVYKRRSSYIRFYNCLKEKMHWKQISFTLGINIVSAQTRFDTIRTSSMKQGRGKMKEARNVKSFLFKVAIPPILFTAKFLMWKLKTCQVQIQIWL